MICPTSLAFFLSALSPAAWNSRNRRRISLWSALRMTIACDDMGFPLVMVGGQIAVPRRAPLHPAAKRELDADDQVVTVEARAGLRVSAGGVAVAERVVEVGMV